MAYNRKYLAAANARLDRIRRDNISEHGRRLKVIYEKIPEIKEIDYARRNQMPMISKIMISKADDIEEQIAALGEKNLDLAMRRAELLVENGFPADYLDEIHSCSICNDSGRDSSGKICSCLRKLYNMELTNDLSTLLKTGDECFENFDLSLYPSSYDDRYGCAPAEQMKAVYEICRKFAENYPNVNSNLMLTGEPGLGKTYLSACIAREVAGKGYSVFYESSSAALGAFERQQFSREASEREDAANTVKQLLSCDLLILDDLGTEFTTPAVLSALYTLINTRLNSGKAMIVNTNLLPDELKSRYSPAIASRLNYDFQILYCIGNDIRAIIKDR